MMKIKPFIIIIYTIAGLLISAITAFMTFMIIGTPIGQKMFLQIIFTIVFVLPIIIAISYFFGRYLSQKFNTIEQRLHHIKEEDFKIDKSSHFIEEIKDINENMNFLSHKLDSLINDLKQKNQNLSNLLISMAHDVKTPITILNGHIEEIEDGLVSQEELPNTLKDMRNELDFLNELTIDMLDFISSMQTHKAKEDISLQSFIENEVFPLVPKKENVVFLNSVHDDFICYFNKTDLKKISLNILGNASKFTRKGHIKVDTLKDTIIFENTGEEIPNEYQTKIFEPFFTVEKSKNRKQTGFGLGLSIVKNLALNNGYKCYLKSSDKEKTIFYLKKINDT
jgi:signal transduction histidine kinase